MDSADDLDFSDGFGLDERAGTEGDGVSSPFPLVSAAEDACAKLALLAVLEYGDMFEGDLARRNSLVLFRRLKPVRPRRCFLSDGEENELGGSVAMES